MTNELDERNWTPPSPERMGELRDQYRDEGHLCFTERSYLTAESVERAKAHDFPADHKEIAPADEYQPWCTCMTDGPVVSDWRTARAWIRRHREQHGLAWQEFVSVDTVVAPHLRDHEVVLDLDAVGADQGKGGWLALCDCETLGEEVDFFATYEDAVAAAVEHMVEHDGRWEEGHPKPREEYEQRP